MKLVLRNVGRYSTYQSMEKISFISNNLSASQEGGKKDKGSLYLGSHYAHNITAVLTIMSGSQSHKHRMSQRMSSLRQAGIVKNYYYSPMTDPIETWAQGSQFMASCLSNSNLLVHCVYGKSRSPSMVAAYLILYQKNKVEEAINLIEQRRKGVTLYGDWKQELEQFYKRNYQQC